MGLGVQGFSVRGVRALRCKPRFVHQGVEFDRLDGSTYTEPAKRTPNPLRLHHQGNTSLNTRSGESRYFKNPKP